MGLLQPDVGHGGRGRKSRLSGVRKAITVHSLRHAHAAASAAAAARVPILLLSAPSAAASAGPGWFSALARSASASRPDADIQPVLDCGDMPGYALAALRHGLKTIRYDGATIGAIEDIARQLGATVLRQRPLALDLGDGNVPEGDDHLLEACRNWLENE